MRATVLFALLFGACAGCATSNPRPADPPTLIIRGELLNRLDVLAQGLRHEIIVCLTGVRANEHAAVATGFHMPLHLRSGPARVHAGSCPDGTLALWHNHIAPVPSVGWCALSPVDVRSMQANEWPFAVVHVRAGVWCWWNRDQLAAADTTSTLMPIEGQYSVYVRDPPNDT